MSAVELYSETVKDAVYVSRKRRVEDGVDTDFVLLFSRMVKGRVMIDFKYYKDMQDLDQFRLIWTHGLILCSVHGHQLTFSDQLI